MKNRFLFPVLAVMLCVTSELAFGQDGAPDGAPAAWSRFFSTSESDAASQPGGSLAMVPRAPLAAIESHPMRLLASDFSLADVELDPTDPTVIETFETPTLASVSLPGNPSRTSLLLCASGPYIYSQIPSSAPFRFGGAYRINFTSSVLPGPFSLNNGFNTQGEFVPSTQRIIRTFDPAGCAGVDEKLLGPFLATHFGLTAEQGQLLARALLASDMTIYETVMIRVRSVGFFDVGNAALQVFGD